MRDLDRYQADYAALPFEATQAAYRRRHLLETLARLRPASLLEVGCGLDPLFMHYPGCRNMHLVEPAAAFHERALAASQGRAGVHVHLGTLEQVAPSLAGMQLDCIVMSSVLHEAPDPQALLAAARTLCTDGTTLLLYMPNADSFHRQLAVAMGLIKDVHELSATQARMQQAATYDRASLAALLGATGFEVVESGSFFIKPFTHAQMAALREQGFMTDAMLDGLYAMSARLPGMGSELFAIARRRD